MKQRARTTVCLTTAALCMALLICSGPQRARAEPISDLRASVGRLLVPSIRYQEGRARHFQESCSATLITGSADSTASRLLLSAWYCIEFHRDLTRPPLFQDASGQLHPARVLLSGGSMYSDWALLELEDAMPGAVTLATGSSGDELRMAGYPRDAAGHTASGIGGKAAELRDEPGTIRKLQVSAPCRITGNLGRDATTDCVLSKGASGGAVFSIDAVPRYLGVISQGDQQTQSIFVPVERFLQRITPYLQARARP